MQGFQVGKKYTNWLIRLAAFLALLSIFPALLSMGNANLWSLAASKILLSHDTNKLPLSPKNHPRASLWRGIWSKDRGDFSAAISILENVPQTNHQDPISILILGDAYAGKGDVKQAIRLWMSIGATTRLSDLGHQALASKKYDDAIAALEASVDLQPNSVTTVSELATAKYEDKDVSGAVDLLQQSIGKNPGSKERAALLITLGRIYEDEEAWDSAINVYNQVIEIQPDNADAYLGLGRSTYKGKGQAPEAISYIQSALNLVPEKSSGYLELGRIYQGEGKYPLASEWLQKAIDHDPDNIWLYSAYVQNLEESGDTLGAIHYLSTTRAKFLKEPHFSYLLSSLYQKLGDHDQAVTWAEKTVALDNGKNQSYIMLLAEVYEEAGQPQQAVLAYKRIPADSDFYPEAQTNLSRLLNTTSSPS